MRRRNIIGLAAGLLLAAGKTAAFAGPDRIRHVAVLLPVPKKDPNFAENEQVLRDVLLRHGWVEGRNLTLTFASVGSNPAEISRLLPEILTPEPDVIVSRSTAVALALQRRPQKTPVVFTQVSDPVGQGIVSTMQKPGGNMTGFTVMEPSIGGKWVGLLREIDPDLTRVAFLMHQASSPISAALSEAITQASRSLGLETLVVPLQAPPDIAPAFARLSSLERVGILVSPGAFTLENRVLITTLAGRYRIPALYPFRYFVTVGGLASYGTDELVWFQQAGDYVDRILKGAKPGDLPIQGPNRLSFVLNAMVAEDLGLAITPALLARADDVID